MSFSVFIHMEAILRYCNNFSFKYDFFRDFTHIEIESHTQSRTQHSMISLNLSFGREVCIVFISLAARRQALLRSMAFNCEMNWAQCLKERDVLQLNLFIPEAPEKCFGFEAG